MAGLRWPGGSCSKSSASCTSTNRAGIGIIRCGEYSKRITTFRGPLDCRPIASRSYEIECHALMAEADDTAAKVCKALQDEHEKRARYFKQGKVQKYALQDTVWVERHHKDVLSRHRQASWYVPGVIVRKVGQDVYAVRVGDNKILDRDHTQLRPRAPDPSGRPVTFEFMAGDVDSDDEGEDDDFTAEKILADKPDPGTPGGRLYKVRWK